jgi:hypothetical protein
MALPWRRCQDRAPAAEDLREEICVALMSHIGEGQSDSGRLPACSTRDERCIEAHTHSSAVSDKKSKARADAQPSKACARSQGSGWFSLPDWRP